MYPCAWLLASNHPFPNLVALQSLSTPPLLTGVHRSAPSQQQSPAQAVLVPSSLAPTPSTHRPLCLHCPPAPSPCSLAVGMPCLLLAPLNPLPSPCHSALGPGRLTHGGDSIYGSLPSWWGGEGVQDTDALSSPLCCIPPHTALCLRLWWQLRHCSLSWVCVTSVAPLTPAHTSVHSLD